MVEDEKGQDLSLAKVEKGYDIAPVYDEKGYNCILASRPRTIGITTLSWPRRSPGRGQEGSPKASTMI